MIVCTQAYMCSNSITDDSSWAIIFSKISFKVRGILFLNYSLVEYRYARVYTAIEKFSAHNQLICMKYHSLLLIRPDMLIGFEKN